MRLIIFSVTLSCCISSFGYQWLFGKGDYNTAFTASYFQIVQALILVWALELEN